jgi:hypothetical protein
MRGAAGPDVTRCVCGALRGAPSPIVLPLLLFTIPGYYPGWIRSREVLLRSVKATANCLGLRAEGGKVKGLGEGEGLARRAFQL